MSAAQLTLRYGCNPHQQPASVHREMDSLPFQVLNGAPGYVNLLDALQSWQLVQELSSATGLPSAHVLQARESRWGCGGLTSKRSPETCLLR